MISLSLKRFQTLEILFEVQVLNLLTTDDFEPNKLYLFHSFRSLSSAKAN